MWHNKLGNGVMQNMGAMGNRVIGYKGMLHIGQRGTGEWGKKHKKFVIMNGANKFICIGKEKAFTFLKLYKMLIDKSIKLGKAYRK